MAYSTLTVRLTEKEAAMINRLKQKIGQTSSTKALIKAADKILNELPFIEARMDEYHKNFLLYKEKYLNLSKLVKQRREIDRDIDEIVKNVK